MAFVPTPGIVMVTPQLLSDDGVVAINRLYCAATEVPTMTDLEEIGDAFYDAFVANIIPNTQSTWSLIGLHMRAMNEAEGLQFDHPGTFPVAGGAVGGAETPSQVSYTITLNTGLVGRSARGRIYGIGMPISYQQGNRLTNAGQSALQSVWNLVRSAMETAGHALQVVSFQEGGVVRTEGRPLAVVSLAARFPLATQRRRLS